MHPVTAAQTEQKLIQAEHEVFKKKKIILKKKDRNRTGGFKKYPVEHAEQLVALVQALHPVGHAVQTFFSEYLN